MKTVFICTLLVLSVFSADINVTIDGADCSSTTNVADPTSADTLNLDASG